MQPRAVDPTAPEEVNFLSQLDQRLRRAIVTALGSGHAELGVALDDARNFLEMVLNEANPPASRVFVARLRAEMALETYARLCGDGVAGEHA